MIALDTMLFQGIKGTIQKAKPVFEPIYRLGGNQVYMQRLRTEPKQSNIVLWQVFTEYVNAKAHERELAALVGLPKTLVVDELETYSKFIVLDYTYTFKAGKGQILVEYQITCLADEAPDTDAPVEPGD